MTDNTETKKQPSKADYVKMHKEEKDRADAAEEKLTKLAMVEGTSEHTIQYREKNGIYEDMERKAKAKRLTVNKWVQKIIREKLGYYYK